MHKSLDKEHERCIISPSRAPIVPKRREGKVIMSIGNRLRELRGSRTQRDVAAAVGITTSSYAMYERDERTPRDEVKARLAKFYNVTVQELFFS